MYLTEMIKVLPTQPGRYWLLPWRFLMFYSISSAGQDSALASRKETLLSEQGCLYLNSPRCPASAFTCEHTNLCSYPRASGHVGSRVAGALAQRRWETEGVPALHPPPAHPALPRCTHSPGPRFPGPRKSLVFFDIINTKKKARNTELLLAT